MRKKGEYFYNIEVEKTFLNNTPNPKTIKKDHYVTVKNVWKTKWHPKVKRCVIDNPKPSISKWYNEFLQIIKRKTNIQTLKCIKKTSITQEKNHEWLINII